MSRDKLYNLGLVQDTLFGRPPSELNLEAKQLQETKQSKDDAPTLHMTTVSFQYAAAESASALRSQVLAPGLPVFQLLIRR